MSNISSRNGTPEEMKARGEAFRAAVAKSRLSLIDFGAKTGLSRNQMYRLSKGQKPTAEQEVRIDTVLKGN